MKRLAFVAAVVAFAAFAGAPTRQPTSRTPTAQTPQKKELSPAAKKLLLGNDRLLGNDGFRPLSLDTRGHLSPKTSTPAPK